MYAISTARRIYSSFFLLLCAAFFLAPTVANANDGYWSLQERRFISGAEVTNRVNNILTGGVKRPAGSTTSTLPTPPSFSTNSTGGLSATTDSVIKTMGQPSSFTSTLNNSVSSAQAALKSCVRSPVCAGRALGTGAVIYEGVNAWKDVYEFAVGSNGVLTVERPLPVPPSNPTGSTCNLSGVGDFSSCQAGFNYYNSYQCLTSPPSWICPITLVPNGTDGFNIRRSDGGTAASLWYISNACPSGSVNSSDGCQSLTEIISVPVSDQELDDAIENYEPAVSDAPIVFMSGAPETITLSNPASAELPATTTTNTNSNGQTTTSVTNSTINYNITNNNTSSPTINNSIVETTTNYDTTGNVTNTSTSTTSSSGVQSDAPEPSTTPSSAIVLEMPAFCSWATIVCEWMQWTVEPLDNDEPELSVLISEFEPDENQYNSSIGSGSCPAPMSLNLGIIQRTVEVSYQPFCDFLDMIRPLVIAGAWLLSAFMYVGVLRRG